MPCACTCIHAHVCVPCMCHACAMCVPCVCHAACTCTRRAHAMRCSGEHARARAALHGARRRRRSAVARHHRHAHVSARDQALTQQLPGLQPFSSRPATLCHPGLQPCVGRAAALFIPGCSRMPPYASQPAPVRCAEHAYCMCTALCAHVHPARELLLRLRWTLRA